MTEKCEWPGCDKDGICSSGNFNRHNICEEHFFVTNGNGKIMVNWKDIIELSYLLEEKND